MSKESLERLERIMGNFADDKQMKKSVHFTLSPRLTTLARFLPRSSQLQIRTLEGSQRSYRAGQVDPSVIAAALRATLRSSNVPLSDSEALVVLTSGTPEAVVAGLVCGFRHVIFVAGVPEEAEMMTVPSVAQEREGPINYSESGPQSSMFSRKRAYSPDAFLTRL